MLLILKNIGSLILNRGIDSFLFLLIVPYLTRVLGAEEYGIIAYSLSITFFILVALRYGFDNFVLCHLRSDQSTEYHSIVISNIIISKLFIYVLALLIVAVLSVLFLERNICLLILLLSISAFGESFNTSIYLVLNKNTKVIIYSSLFRLLYIVLLSYVFVSKDGGSFAYAAIYTSAYLISALTICFYTYHQYGMTFKSDLRFVSKLFLSSFGYFLNKVFLTLSDKIYILLAGVFLAFTEVGYFDLGMKLYIFAIMPAQLSCVVLLPGFVKNKGQSDILLIKLISAFFLFLFMFSPVTNLLKHYVDILFFGYDTNSNIYIYFYLSSIFAAASVVIGELFLLPKKQTKSYFLSSLFSFTLAMVIFVFLLVFNGISLHTFLLAFAIFKFIDMGSKSFLVYRYI